MGVICSAQDDGLKPPDLKVRHATKAAHQRPERGTVYRGTLSKREDNLEAMRVAGGFRHRVVSLNQGVLNFKKETHSSALSQIQMHGAKLDYDEAKCQILLQSVSVGESVSRVFCFQLESPEEAAAWVSAMMDSIQGGTRDSLPIESFLPTGPCVWKNVSAAWLGFGHQFGSASTATFEGEIKAFSSAKPGCETVNMAESDPSTYWEPEREDSEWCIVDMGRARLVSAVKLVSPSADACFTSIQLYSSDLPGYAFSKWCIAADFSLTKQDGLFSPKEFNPRVARYWKLCVSQSHSGSCPQISSISFLCSQSKEQDDPSLAPSESQSECGEAQLSLSPAPTSPSSSHPPAVQPSPLSKELLNQLPSLDPSELSQYSSVEPSLPLCRAGRVPSVISDATTPRSFYTSVSQVSRAPPPPKRAHYPQPPVKGVADLLLKNVRARLLPVVEAAASQAAQFGPDPNGAQMLIIGANNSATKLLDRLLPHTFWSGQIGLWELTLNKQVINQCTAGHLPDVDVLLVVGAWDTQPNAAFQSTVSFIAAFTAAYPKRSCTVIIMHASETPPDFVLSEISKCHVFTELKRSDIVTASSNQHGFPVSPTISPSQAQGMAAAGLGWSPRTSDGHSPNSLRDSVESNSSPGLVLQSGNLQLVPIRVGLVPDDFDPDMVFSLEQPEQLRTLLSDHARTDVDDTHPQCESVEWVCNVLDHLEDVVGYIPHKHARGFFSCCALEKLKSISQSRQKKVGSITRVVVIDRTIDMVTPLLSQHSYAGLVEDLFTGDYQAAKDFLANESSHAASKAEDQEIIDRLMFHPSADKIWKAIHDVSITDAVKITGSMAHEYSLQEHQASQYEDQMPCSSSNHLVETRQLIDAHTRLAKFVKNQLVAKHPRSHVSSLVTRIYGEEPNLYALMLCEQALYNPMNSDFTSCNLDQDEALVLDFLKTSIRAKEPLLRVMRLICVASQVSSGMTPKHLEQLRNTLDRVYGHSAVMTLESLIYLRLIRMNKQSKTTARWLSLSKEFELGLEPTNSDYGYPGYIPLSTRIVERTERCTYNFQSFSQKLEAPKSDQVPRTIFQEIAPNSSREAQLTGLHKTINTCQHCQQPFGLMMRKNMCRFCGACVCSSCHSGEIAIVTTNAREPKNGFRKESRRACRRCEIADRRSVDPPPGQTLVLFLGGCTRGEVLSLRQLAQDADDGSSYLVATTGYISGHVLMRSLQVKWD